MRESIRRTFIYYLPVKDLMTGEILGHLADMTRQGCLILSETPLSRGEQKILQVELPVNPWFRNTRLRFKASLKWIKREKDRDLYHLGMRIIKKEKRSDKVIELLIQKLGFSDGEKKIRMGDRIPPVGR